ncbi:glyoxalase domain containing 4 [Nesidiocoris tenuis]|uniref:Glyoxalase domain containing 4 n=1 Tax=Nesidiocoris tenuis TaxID=355587 RepID=A0ABN7BBZ8_9HEMI|nr:glyoxalase domain containing 4 [Nesidiocoris tenuis]
MLPTAKSLHWSLIVRDRVAEIAFYKDILGMKVINHREFKERGGRPPKGFKGMWSVTRLQYGSEPNRFAVQILFSYDTQLQYQHGNRYVAMTIQSSKVLENAVSAGMTIKNYKKGSQNKILVSPAGYKFVIVNKPEPESSDPIKIIHLKSSDVMETLNFWHCLLGAKVVSGFKNHSIVVRFGDHGVKIKFCQTDRKITETSHGCSLTCRESLENIESLQKCLKEHEIELPLDITPLDVNEDGNVKTMIVHDFDGQEIILCDEFGYEKHNVPQGDAVELLNDAMRREKAGRGEDPIVTKTDATLFRMVDAFDNYERCRRERSLRILQPFPHL